MINPRIFIIIIIIIYL